MPCADTRGLHTERIADGLSSRSSELSSIVNCSPADISGSLRFPSPPPITSTKAIRPRIIIEFPDIKLDAIGVGRGSARQPKKALAGLSAMPHRSEEHTSELQSLMRISYAVFCLSKKKTK